MVNKSTDLPETLDCTGKDCECAIPVADCFYVHNAEVPQIGIKCPECGKVAALSKTKSIAYINAIPAIQAAIDSAVGFRSPEPDEHESLADRVLRLIDVYGYTQSKWTNAKKVIRQLIENTPRPHTVPTLNEILTSRRIEQVDAYQIANLAIGGENQSAMSVSGIFAPNGQMYPQQQFPPSGMYPQAIGQPQMPYPPPVQQPAHQYPPPVQPQMPYPPPVQQPERTTPPADDSITIVEKIDSDGNVTERVIKQPKAAAHEASPPVEASMTEQFKEMIEVMTNAGMIRTNEPTAEEVRPLTADDLATVLLQYSESGNGSDDRYDGMARQIESLKSEIRTGREDALQAQIESLKEKVSKTSTDSRLSDSQFAESTKKDIEDIRIRAIKDVGETIAKPLFEMQATQSKLQTLMMVRDLERQDNAPPGTYAQIFGASNISDDDVQGDLGKWRDRASKLGASA